MKFILRNLLYHWKIVILVFILLCAQAVCDLALPKFTSAIIDTGIQNSGVRYASPIKMRAETYQTALSLMKDSEAAALWQKEYAADSDGDYYLLDSSGDNLEYLDGYFTEYLAALNTVSASSDRPAGDVENMGPTMMHSSAIAFTVKEYKALGLDIEEIQTGYLWSTGLKMMCVTLIMILASAAVSFLSARTGSAIGRDLREKLFDKVVGFSQADINKFSTASLITRSTNDVQQVQQVCVMMLRMILYAPIIAVGGIIMVIRTKAQMSWIIVMGVLALITAGLSLMAVAMPKFKIMQTLIDKVNLISRELLTGITVIRAFGREKWEEKRFDKANRELTSSMLFTNRVLSLMMPLMSLLMNAISILIVWTAAHRIENGIMEVGTMTAFITYTMMIVSSFLIITAIAFVLPRAAVAANRIDEVLSTESVITEKEDRLELNKCRGRIDFDNVSFHYPDADENTLSNISFSAMPGQTTAIIGSTGSGKSTLVNLLLRFYDPTEGSIKIDGHDIKDLSLASLRGNIGYAAQKGVLFSGTIAENLRFGCTDAGEDRLLEAASVAQIADFIAEKEEGYDSALAQGGGNVSGGQKQRLSIARALVRDVPVYVFDDSFSALDYKTDLMLRQAVREKMTDRTIIIVAQRVNTIIDADRILVLDEGHLAGQGTHAELMKNCDVYRQIVYSQLSEQEIDKLKTKPEVDNPDGK